MTSARLYASPSRWPSLLQDPPWRNAQPLPALPEQLVWSLPKADIRWNWSLAESSFHAANGGFSNHLGYFPSDQWAFTRQPPVQPDWEARAHQALFDEHYKDRIRQSMLALAPERHFPDDWTRWPAQHQLLLACGVPAAQVTRVAQKPMSEAGDFSEPRCAYHHTFAAALPTRLVLGYWEAFGQDWTPIAEQIERLWLADETQVPLLLQTHRLPLGRDKLIFAQAIGWPELAPWVATCLGRVAWRDAQAQSWLTTYMMDAADGLWPEALNPDAPHHEACWAALRFLHLKGETQWLERRLRNGLKDANPESTIDAAWHTALLRLNANAEHCLPSPLPKLTKALALALSAADALELKASAPKGEVENHGESEGQLLPPEAMQDALMIAMLGKPDAPYVGLAQLQAACTRESLAQWARSLYDIWQAEGMPAKARFILPLQGWLGDDATATRLHKGIVLWRSKLDRVRAYDGITALSRMGGNGALTWLSALAEHKRYDDLKTRAKSALKLAAKRRGMGMEEMADCTLPDLGFNAQSRQLLDFGPRQFELLLDEHLQLRMRELAAPEATPKAATPSTEAAADPEAKAKPKTQGKTKAAKPAKPPKAASTAWLKTLPKPRVSDDADLAAQAKRQLKEVQTQLKALGRRQLERMEAAMCSERLWGVAHFQQHLVAHPLARVLTQRLVFGVYPASTPTGLNPELNLPIALFRVAEDGQPSNAHDEPMGWDELAALAGIPLGADGESLQASDDDQDPDSPQPAPACIGIVHPLALAAMPDGEALSQAFAGLLADYELLQPFEQLGREVTPMPDALLAQSSLSQWQGRQLSTGSLLGLMQQGWQREVGDGGMVCALALPAKSRSGQPLSIGVDFEPGWFVAGGVDTQEGQALGSFHLSGQVPRSPAASTSNPAMAEAPSAEAMRAAQWQDLSPIARSELLRSLNRLAWWERP